MNDVVLELLSRGVRLRDKTLDTVSRQVVDQLRRFIENHHSVSRRAEPNFIRVGDQLQKVFGDATGLTQKISGSIAILGNRENGVLASLRNNAENALQELRNSRREVSDKISSVEGIFGNLRIILRKTDELARIGLHMKAVGINVGVESTRSPAARMMFSTVAEEVVQLAGKVRAVADAITSDCEEGIKGQQHAHGEIVRNLKSLDGVSLEAERAVQEAVSRIENVMEKALEVLGGANDHARAISDQIGEIVMRIQLHDSMSQRVEHIVHALGDLADDLQNAERKSNGDAGIQHLARARKIILLQRSQVEHIIDEIEEANLNSLRAFEVIDRRVNDLAFILSSLQHSNDSGRSTSSAEEANSLAILKSSLARLSGLMAEGAAMIERLHTCGRKASAMAARLFVHKKNIEDIRFDIHLKALNTIVKASHLGERGRAMEVLAQETKRLSDQANEFVDEAVRLHDYIDQAVNALATECASECRNTLLDTSSETIAEAFTMFNQSSADASEQGSALQEEIVRASAGLGFLQDLVGEMAEQRKELKAVDQLLEPLVGDVCQTDEDSAMSLASLESHYTMQKERELHSVLFLETGKNAGAANRSGETSGKAVVPPQTAINESAAGQDLGDNVELF